MLTWLAPVLVFGLVVFIHELGHFLAAKLVGVYAPVFSIGWGSRLWGIRLGETEYRLSWFPIGGYVSMASREDELLGGGQAPDGGPSPSEAASPVAPDASGPRRGLAPIPWDPAAMAPFGPRRVPSARWIESKSAPQRIFVMSAGVLMNFLLALVVSVTMFAALGRPYLLPVVQEVLPDRPAARAGLLPGDTIAAVDGRPMKAWTDVLTVVGASAGRPLTLSVRRAGGAAEVRVTPEAARVPDPASGVETTLGRIGAAPASAMRRERLGPVAAVVAGADATWGMTRSVVTVVQGLFSGRVSVKQLGGPIAIAKTSVQAARSGLEALFVLVAFLSVNIGVLNLLPIPVLDGGQILLAAAEGVRGRPFSDRFREGFARIGIAAVGLLFLLVMLNDVARLFGR